MRNLINFPYYPTFMLLFSFIVSTNLYAQNGNGNENSEPTILDVKATSKSVCPTSTINISFILKNGRGSANSGAYFTTDTEFTISLIYLNNLETSVIVNNSTSFSLTPSEIPSATNDATSLTITRPYTIPIDTETRSDYRIEISSNNPIIAGSISSRSDPFTISDNNYWSGAIDSDWNKAGNWDCNLIPSYINNAVINNVVTSYPLLNTGAPGVCQDLVIESGSSLKVLDNTLNINGAISNSGTFNSLNGSIAFLGTAAQTIPSNVFFNNRIRELIIDNAAGVSSLGKLEISGILNVENGNFNTGDKLTLISDATQTALIDGNGNGEIIGEVTMQRYLDRAFGYKYFSSPFQNTVIDDFSPYMDFEDPVTGFPHFYRYNENRNLEVDGNVKDATGWEAYITSGNSLNVAEGYALNFGASTTAETIELVGEVNNGVIPVRQLENNDRDYTKGFHLVGNPYPSPIDWDALQGWTKTNIDDGIYFFTASDDSQYSGTYTAYVNDVSTNPMVDVDGRSSNIIPSMQGFFIKVTEDKVTGSFGMDNRVREIDFDQEFLRTQVTDQKSLIRLEAGFKTSDRKDPLVIYFSSYATTNFEKEMDAHKLMNTDLAVPSFYNLTENKKELAINAIPFPESRSYKKIPLGIKADKNGEMKINLASVENLSSNFNIYLIDHEKSKGQNLRRNPEYSFSTEAGTHNSRFELMFSEEEVTSPAIAFNEPFDVEVEDGNVVVSLNLNENQEGILRASTMTGQILQVREAGGKDLVIFDGITSSGVYIINLQLGKAQHAKKVVIRK